MKTGTSTLVILAHLLLWGVPSLALAQTFAGTVLDPTDAPIGGAAVVVNHADRGTTDGAGAFSIVSPRVPFADDVIATRAGWLSVLVQVPAAADPSALTIHLESYPSDPATFAPEPPATCTECHGAYGRGWGGRPLVGGFQRSAHAVSALSPRVLDIWRGTASGRADPVLCAEVGGRWSAVLDASGATVERCHVGVGLLPDLNAQCGHPGQPECDDHGAPAGARPTVLSDCAGCHTPGAALRLPAELDLDAAEADPVASSVTCAGCHRITEVLDPNAPGVLVGARAVRGHPPDGDPVGLGPLDDAATQGMAAGFAPLFATSTLCAPCHQDTYHAAGMNPRWEPGGVPSEQTYAEWLETPYASGARERTCQGCHMPALEDLGVVVSGDLLIGTDGPVRLPAEVHAHDFSPRTDAAARAASLALAVTATASGAEIVVDASLTNVGVGHGWPSGVTSRNGLLVVTAEIDGMELAPTSGDTLPLYAGSYAHGTVAAVAGSTVTLDHAVDASMVGRELRLWSDTSEPHEHTSWSVLRTLPLAERGLFRTRAIGRHRILAVRGADVDVEGAPPAADGAHWAIGDETRLAGAPGLGFAKVSVAADGTPNVPFWMATDLVSDNRLAPDETQRSQHHFALPSGARGTVVVHARLLYRKAFADLAAQRGWTDNEQLAAEAMTSVVLATPDAGPPGDGGAPADGGVGVDGGAGPGGAGGCGCRAGGARDPATGLAVSAVFCVLVATRRRRRAARRAR